MLVDSNMGYFFCQWVSSDCTVQCLRIPLVDQMILLNLTCYWCLTQLGYRMAMVIVHDVAFLDCCFGCFLCSYPVGCTFSQFLTINFPDGAWIFKLLLRFSTTVYFLFSQYQDSLSSGLMSLTKNSWATW